MIIKLVTILLAALSVAKSYLDYRKKREPLVMFIFWAVIWILAAVLVVYPLLIERLLSYIQERTITFGSIVSMAFIFMLYIVYRVYTKAARIEYNQAELIRRIGLERSKKRKKA